MRKKILQILLWVFVCVGFGLIGWLVGRYADDHMSYTGLVVTTVFVTALVSVLMVQRIRRARLKTNEKEEN